MRAIAALVASLIEIWLNTWLAESETGVALRSADAEASSARFLKQGRQYTGLSGAGRNGTVAELRQSAQTISWRCLIPERRRRVGEVAVVIRRDSSLV